MYIFVLLATCNGLCVGAIFLYKYSCFCHYHASTHIKDELLSLIAKEEYLFNNSCQCYYHINFLLIGIQFGLFNAVIKNFPFIMLKFIVRRITWSIQVITIFIPGI